MALRVDFVIKFQLLMEVRPVEWTRGVGYGVSFVV